MICQLYQNQNNLTDAQMCRLLNESRPSCSDPPVFEHRLSRLKQDKKATKLERYLLDVATDGEVTSYK